MILGRNTQQWLGLLTAFASMVQTITVVLLPGLDPGVVAVVLGSIIGFLGVAIAFIAHTATTPTSSPTLKVGTPINVTDEAGATLGHTPVPTPPTPPEA